jgi:hypothetical protein
MIRISTSSTAFAIIAMLFSSCPAAPTSQPSMEAAPKISEDDQKLQNLLDRRLPNVQLPGVALSDAIDFIHDVTGADIYVDWTSLGLAGVAKDVHVDVTAKDTPLRQILRQILDATGSTALGFEVIQGRIVISTKLNFQDRRNQVGPYLPELSDPATAAILDKRLAQVEMPQVAFSDMIDFLRDITGDSIVVKWNVLAHAGIAKNAPVMINLHQARLSTVLYFMLDQFGPGKLGYTTQPGEKPVWNGQRQVNKPAPQITISTIDDLIANKGYPTTQPN